MATGPATELIQATATSVGAGMLLGGFVAGLLALVSGAESARRDQSLAVWSSLAGLAMVAIVVLEAVLR